MIQTNSLPAVKDILANHLKVMDGGETECVPCKLFDTIEETAEPDVYEDEEVDVPLNDEEE